MEIVTWYTLSDTLLCITFGGNFVPLNVHITLLSDVHLNSTVFPVRVEECIGLTVISVLSKYKKYLKIKYSYLSLVHNCYIYQDTFILV